KLKSEEKDFSHVDRNRTRLRIFAHLTMIWTNVCSTALARRRVFTPRPKADISRRRVVQCSHGTSVRCQDSNLERRPRPKTSREDISRTPILSTVVLAPPAAHSEPP